MGKDLIAALIVSAVFVAGCATPEVVEVTCADDSNLMCAEINTGIAEAEWFREAAQKEKGAIGTNVAAVLFFPLAMLATYSNIEETTTVAMERESHLADLYREKGCGGGAATRARLMAVLTATSAN